MTSVERHPLLLSQHRLIRKTFECHPIGAATFLQAIGAPTEPIAPVVEHLLGFKEKELRLEHLDPEQLKRQLFLAVKEICQYQCRHCPVLLVVEDFQWADAASVERLRALVERVPDRPLMLLLVARPTPQMGMIYSTNVDSTVIRLQRSHRRPPVKR